MLASPSSSVNSPSFGRRRVLKEMDDANGNQLNVIDGYPLSYYIEMGDEYHKRFENAFHNSNLNEAYNYGMRYTKLVIVDLPNHHEWNTRKNTTEQREKMRSQASKILSRLEEIFFFNDSNIVLPSKQQHSNVGLEKQQSVTQKARRKIRQFLTIPKNSRGGITSTVKKNNSAMENSSLSSDTVSSISTKDLMSGPVVPSLDTIRNSRQHELLQPSQVY